MMQVAQVLQNRRSRVKSHSAEPAGAVVDVDHRSELRLPQPTPGAVLRVDFRYGKKLLLISIMLVGPVVIAECVLRLDIVEGNLPLPGRGLGLSMLDLNVELLERFVADEAGVDCVFIGDSTVHRGIDPEQFTRDVTARTGHTFRAANLTSGGMPPAGKSVLVQLAMRYLAVGATTVMMCPHQWVRRPGMLLNMIEKHRVTAFGMPNFAFVHMVRTTRPQIRDAHDLSSVRMIMWGSEPCQQQSQESFVRHFAASGLRPEVITSAYGMAEMTLLVTSAALEQPPRVECLDGIALSETGIASALDASTDRGASYVCCGRPAADTEIRILGEGNRVLPERHVGEIVVRSPSMFSGYHRRDDLTENVLRDGWYHTGDIGYLADGELFFCSRKKDLIIVAGQNIHPKDIESIAAQIDGIKPHGVVAFGIPCPSAGTKLLAVACELERRHTDAQRQHIEAELRRKVAQHIGVTLSRVFLVSRGQLEKTENGKLARSRNRDKFAARAA